MRKRQAAMQRLVLKPNAKVRRGLKWILRHAEAIYDDVAHEKGTGQFVGTSPKEVVEAMTWIQEVTATDSKANDHG